MYGELTFAYIINAQKYKVVSEMCSISIACEAAKTGLCIQLLTLMLKKDLFIFLLCAWIFFLHVYMYATFISSVSRGQMLLDAQDLELWTVVSCYLGSGYRTWLLIRSVTDLSYLTTKPPLQSIEHFVLILSYVLRNLSHRGEKIKKRDFLSLFTLLTI